MGRVSDTKEIAYWALLCESVGLTLNGIDTTLFIRKE